MLKRKVFIKVILFIVIIPIYNLLPQGDDRLSITSTKEVGQIEVGNTFVGIEIHKSFPLLNRISFYYPFANSIDISEDYWKRENYRIMSIGLKVGDSPKKLLSNQVYQVNQTPYSVSFQAVEDESGIKISYQFCKDDPAIVVTYEITNLTERELDYEFYTRLDATLRTSHTYNKIEKAYTEFEKDNMSIVINYPFKETGYSKIFVSNAGLKPSSFTSNGMIGNDYSNIDEWWLNTISSLSNSIINNDNLSKPTAAFIYKEKLSPGKSFKIVQIIGSLLIAESNNRIKNIAANYEEQVKAYEEFILEESIKKSPIITNDRIIDFTSYWSNAILNTNKHYIDGKIVPMPAQAEYNFYFTHDALLTDLAAVNFDLSRVKQDLEFIISLADTDKTIPHAYYWKDSTFKTEYAGTENWNHFWFTLVCARYVRHSNDTQFLKTLYPYILKSINTALKNKGDDDLMWSFRPDWWDIGNNFGPRAYMTILAIRAMREFTYLTSLVNESSKDLMYYENHANKMNDQLITELWDNDLNYLISYFQDGKEDKHIYMGSLLASHFNLLDSYKNQELLKTAKEKLLDNQLGLYTLFPMDLHLLIDYMKFAGNEAGEPYHYANGGIWPHGNSWYALSLISNGLNSEAYDFIKKTMTLDGIMNSPNGQPALYEYRISDKNNLYKYGKIDKPQFLWAGGWYLYTLYNLFGLRENEWNISFVPFIPNETDSVQLTITINGVPVLVDISGEGNTLSSIQFDEVEIPSAIVPNDVNRTSKIILKLGDTKTPYLNSANAIVISPTYELKTKTLEFDLESFEGHIIELQIISPTAVQNVFINETSKSNVITESPKNELFEINLKHTTELNRNHYSIKFK